jgi:hypothetical protein
LARAAGLFEAFRDSQDELVLMGPADDLHADGEAFVRKTERDRGTGKAG